MENGFRVLGDMVNASIVRLQNGDVIVIDSLASAEQGKELAREAGKDGPISYLINTHEHGDHLAGNKFFDCPIISSALTYEAVGALPEFEPAGLPTMTFSDQLTLYLDEPITLVHTGGHCPGATVLFLPERKLLFTGDLVFNGRMPYMGDANIELWIRTLSRLESWDVEYVVPGHGPVGGKDILTSQRRWLEEFVAQVHVWKESGCSSQEIGQRAIDKYEPAEKWRPMIKRAVESVLS